ncbi:uncharacterized protein EAE98_007399 [Botrytis deweyae]|uniref:Uncharacterized protein n=1 Tax=Botrytis deweyae TaxID=2478750 RepID=A0ABQ7IHT2_9HELO|nr:uncharacterized protein EAE98_007399 [Botrytis deweyae]KAF7924348.1 hypothetical protein EAE98_007399 [Botrytis deweyae]
MPHGPYEVHFPTNQSKFWPETLSASTPDMCSDFSYATTESRCPSGGFSELERWSFWGLHSGPELTTGNLVNIRFYEPYSSTNRQLASSLFPYVALQGLWNIIAPLNLRGHPVSQPKLSSQAAASILQPFIQVKCNIFESDSITTAIGGPEAI